MTAWFFLSGVDGWALPFTPDRFSILALAQDPLGMVDRVVAPSAVVGFLLCVPFFCSFVWFFSLVQDLRLIVGS